MTSIKANQEDQAISTRTPPRKSGKSGPPLIPGIPVAEPEPNQASTIQLPPLLQFQTWPIDRFIIYARNPRKNDTAVDRMCASIHEFGFKVPVLVRSDGEVVDGHLRLKAARQLGITAIPVILCDEWTP